MLISAAMTKLSKRKTFVQRDVKPPYTIGGAVFLKTFVFGWHIFNFDTTKRMFYFFGLAGTDHCKCGVMKSSAR